MNQDGPQAATRHGKHRRHSYKTNAARSLLLLEQRVASLDGKSQSSPQQSPPKAAASVNLDHDLQHLDERFDKLEERLAGIEQRLKPYDEYQELARSAVKKLQEVQTRVQSSSPSPSRSDPKIVELVNDHEASLRELSVRLLQAEDKIEHFKDQANVANSVAQALLQHLKRNMAQDRATADALQLALDGADESDAIQPPSSPRQQETPVENEPDVEAEQRQAQLSSSERREQSPSTVNGNNVTSHRPAKRRAISQIVEEQATNDSTSEKRRRKGPSPLSAEATASPRGESERITTPQVESALSSFKSGGFSSERASEDVMPHTSTTPDVVIPAETRRTSRKRQPTKREPSMVHWKDANKIVKTLRTSVAGKK